MTDTFVPLVTATVAKPRDNGFAALNLKPSATKASDENGKPAVNSAPAAHSPEICAKPTVTLQRTGDIVTSIRVQCGCGQVTELSCVY